jgi:hypothetical protein
MNASMEAKQTVTERREFSSLSLSSDMFSRVRALYGGIVTVCSAVEDCGGCGVRRKNT